MENHWGGDYAIAFTSKRNGQPAIRYRIEKGDQKRHKHCQYCSFISIFWGMGTTTAGNKTPSWEEGSLWKLKLYLLFYGSSAETRRRDNNLWNEMWGMKRSRTSQKENIT